ncbi:host attachment protein [Pistricoccus aurantiacus]|uniref:host attachment protein n=1 Tax=Pistricoccus aurantiacus TaxID=1883414 RepID=UPI0036447BB4
MTTYIVVADAARARIFLRDNASMTEKENLAHAEGRLHEGDLVTDSRGDVHESTSTTSRGAGGENVASEHEDEMFAKQVADRLYDARVKNDLEQLILVAPPKFLGLLKDNLDKPTQKLVIHTLSKDLSKASLDEIKDAVSDLK